MNETIFYHVLPASGQTFYTSEFVRVGTVIRAEGTPELCGAFPHASKRAIDALTYHRGVFVFEGVILRGNVIHDDSKSCANERETVWMLTPQQTLLVLRKWAQWCVEQAKRYVNNYDADDYATRAADYAVAAATEHEDKYIIYAAIRASDYSLDAVCSAFRASGRPFCRYDFTDVQNAELERLIALAVKGELM